MKTRIVAGTVLAVILFSLHSNAQVPTSGLVLRLRSDTGVEQAFGVPATNGAQVVRWLDQSSSANHVTNAVTTPVYLTGVVNGEPVVNFNDASDRLRSGTPLISGSTDFSVFSVLRFSGGGEHVIGANYGIGNASGLEFYVYLNRLRLFQQTVFVSGATTLADNTWYLVQAEHAGGTLTLRVNNTVDATGTLGASIGSSLPWNVGNGADYDASAFGDMAEQIVYTRALSAAERNLVANRLADDYGLSIPEPSATVLAVMAAMWFARPRRRR